MLGGADHGMPFRGGEFGNGLGRQKEWGMERSSAGQASRTDGGSVRKDLRGQRTIVRALGCLREGRSMLGVDGSCRESIRSKCLPLWLGAKKGTDT